MATRILEVLVDRRALPTIHGQLNRTVTQVLATTHEFKRKGPDFRLRSVHADLTTARTVEACAVIGTAHRARALVMRFEQEKSGWLCTLLAVV